MSIPRLEPRGSKAGDVELDRRHHLLAHLTGIPFHSTARSLLDDATPATSRIYGSLIPQSRLVASPGSSTAEHIVDSSALADDATTRSQWTSDSA